MQTNQQNVHILEQKGGHFLLPSPPNSFKSISNQIQTGSSLIPIGLHLDPFGYTWDPPLSPAKAPLGCQAQLGELRSSEVHSGHTRSVFSELPSSHPIPHAWGARAMVALINCLKLCYAEPNFKSWLFMVFAQTWSWLELHTWTYQSFAHTYDLNPMGHAPGPGTLKDVLYPARLAAGM